MRSRVYFIVLGLLTLFTSVGLFVIRKYDIGISLEPNASRLREEQLRNGEQIINSLIANPTIKVGRPVVEGRLWWKREHLLTMCTFSATSLQATLNEASPEAKVGGDTEAPLLDRLREVYIEPIPYSGGEVSELVAELEAVKNRSTNVSQRNDLTALIDCLRQKQNIKMGIVFS